MTWHCAICGRKLRKPALLIRDGLAIGPKCAAQRGLTMVKPEKAPKLPMRKFMPAQDDGQMRLFREVGG